MKANKAKIFLLLFLDIVFFAAITVVVCMVSSCKAAEAFTDENI